MQNLPDKLPDDINALKALVLNQSKAADYLTEKNKQLVTENQHYRVVARGY